MPIRPRSLTCRLIFRLVCVAALVVVSTRMQLGRPSAAGAEVSHVRGYAAVVDGWRSWYGNYGMGALGHAWCIDHGIRAPDPAFAYVPADVEATPETQRAIAWILGAHGRAPDRITAAALMLAVHDLMGASYPSGRLDVDRLGVDRMSGFEGAEASVLARARALKAEALGRRHLETPLALTAAVSPPRPEPGQQSTLEVRLTDRRGAGVGGVLLHAAVSGAVLTGSVEARTDEHGWLRLPFRAGAGENRFDVTGTAPDLALQAFRPTLRPAQRVARPAVVALQATTVFGAAVRHRLTIEKTGDAVPYLPVTGARFEARSGDGVHQLVVGSDGRAHAELPPARYEVSESAPPPGYRRAGPWTVDLANGAAVLRVRNEARRGTALVRKVDAVTGDPVAGAELAVAYDADADGAPDTEVARIMSTHDPTVVSDLLPGTYAVREETPPPGYAASDAVVFAVEPRETTAVVVTNQPRSTVSFEKVPVGLHDPEAMTLEGATFVVAGVGECTTDASGRCSLAAEMLDGAVEYCWEETVAPVGWERAGGGCFAAATAPGGTHVVTVEEVSRYASVDGRKVDAGTRRPLGGAVYDLYRVQDDALGAAPVRRQPEDALELSGHVWVGRAESDFEGLLHWPPQILDYSYCALERRAPAGYLPSTALTCTPGALGRDGAVVELADRPRPPVVEQPPVDDVVIEVVERDAVERDVVQTSVHARPTPAPPPLAATGLGADRLATLGGGLVLAGVLLATRRPLRQ